MERQDNNVANQSSSSNTEQEKDKSVTSQVVEYYQKYSLNRELPKFFSGPPSTFKIEDWHIPPSISKPAGHSKTVTSNILDIGSRDQSTIGVSTEDLTKSESVAVNTTDDLFESRETVAVNTEEIFEETITPSINQTPRPPLVGQDHLYEQPPVCPVSPASSVTSNRKLEWDNGADIGYKNAETQKVLQKSISLPILSKFEYKELQKTLSRLSPEGKTTIGEKLKAVESDSSGDSDFDTKLFNPPYSSSTTESVTSTKRSMYTSTSSSGGSTQPTALSKCDSGKSSNKSQKPESILSFLKTKVGLPLAESTPIVETLGTNKNSLRMPKTKAKPSVSNNETKSNSCEDLPATKSDSLKKWHSQVDLNMVDQVSHYKNLKILKLSISKPVVVECCSYQVPAGEDKLIQTSLPRNCSIAIQTDFDYSNSRQLKPETSKQNERQSVIYVCHSDSDEEQNVQSSGTQTNSEILSNHCNSFEYLSGEEYDQKFVKSDSRGSNEDKESKNIPNEDNYDGRSENSSNSLKSKSASNATDEDARGFTNGKRKHLEQKYSQSSNEGAGSKKSEKSSGSQKENLTTKTGALVGNLKRCPPKSNLTSVTNTISEKVSSSSNDVTTSKSSPLAQLLVAKGDDLENGLMLLQKVRRSKKYDEVTKKFYLKKIIQKLMNTKISSDDSSGTYDSLPEMQKSSKSSSLNDELNLQENKPWVPVGQPANSHLINLSNKKHPNASNNLRIETFTNEIVGERKESVSVQTQNVIQLEQPKNVLHENMKFIPIQISPNSERCSFSNESEERRKRSPLLTLTDNESLKLNMKKATEVPKEFQRGAGDDTSNSIVNELYDTLNPREFSEPVTPAISSSATTDTSSNAIRSKNIDWRKNKTKSEELFEMKSKQESFNSKDHLVRFAKQEREHQLSWINNEISHLNKLKQLLEQKNVSNNLRLRNIVQKPHVQDLKGIEKSTTVYIVTTEKSSNESDKNQQFKFSVCNPKACKNPKCPARYTRSVSTTSQSSKNDTPRNYQQIADKPDLKKLAPSLVCNNENVINVGSERIDLNKARLVSTEQFSAAEKPEGKTSATIKRYTFEIAEEEEEEEEEEGKPSGCACGRRSRCTCKQNLQKVTRDDSISPKTTPNLCHELVATDSISPKDVQATKCYPCDDKDDKVTQTSESLIHPKKSSTTTSSTSTKSSTSAYSSTTNLCRCCKTKYVKTPKNTTPESPKYILCHPCYNQSLQSNYNATAPYYTFPGHVCRCYDGDKSQLIQEMRNTIDELTNLEQEEEYCKCHRAKTHPNSNYCLNCNCKLNSKKGIAYILTLESDDLKRNHKHKKNKHNGRKTSLQEIKIKVQSPRSKKSYRRTESRKRRDSGSNRFSSDDESTKENSVQSKTDYGKNKKKHKKPTLQDYLCTNKPDFVTSAEQRRQCLIDLAYMREKRCQKYKQLLALTNGIPLQNPNDDPHGLKPKRVFSPEEMKKITEKNYKKLPEVQQKLIDNRERQIRKANKLLADMFNQNLRKQVLKGKHSIPSNSSIIKLL